MRIPQPPQPKYTPVEFTFSREKAKDLAEQTITDDRASGREAMLAVMLLGLLASIKEEPKG